MALTEIWTLVSGATEKTFAEWGITSAILTRRTQRADVLEIKLANARFDDAELFAYKSQVVIKRYAAGYPNGTPINWFVGISTKTPRMGRPMMESVSYIFEGPWWYFEHVTYIQGWTFLNDVVYQPDWQYYGITPPTGPAPGTQSISNLILAVDDAGVPITTKAQIEDAANVAIAAGAPLQIGTIDPAFVVPGEAARDLTCSEVIRRMLRWSPDCVTWFDYSTSPPTLNIRRRANLAVANFSVAGQPVSAIEVAARPDLVPPVVRINYEIVTQVNDQDYRTLTPDQYPADISATQPGALVLTINLQGDKSGYMRQYIKTGAIMGNCMAWWKDRLPWLADANITNLVFTANPSGDPNNDALPNGAVYTPIADASVALTPGQGPDGTSLPTDPDAVAPVNNTDGGVDKGSNSTSDGTVYGGMLLEGEMPNWMTGNAQLVLVQQNINYDVVQGNDSNGNPVLEHHVNEAIFVKVMSTDLPTGWYSQLTSVEAGEAIPTGLAQEYYNSLSQIQYEGAFAIIEQEVGTIGGPYLGKVLNLTGGLTEWTSMHAAIFETIENLANGTTRLRFGPVEYLSPKDWITWLRVNRWREIGVNAVRKNGLLTMGSHPVGGTGKHDRGGSASKGPMKATVWAGSPSGGNPGTYSVDVQPTTLASGVPATLPSNLLLQLRPLQVCDAGVTKTVLVLCSQTYTPAS